MDERFSATIDNESSKQEVCAVITSAIAERSLREDWTRQYWLRATLSSTPGEPPPRLDLDFADRVMAALDSSEAAGDRAEFMVDTEAGSSRVVPFEQARRRHKYPRSGWRAGLGMAAAASVVGVVVFAYSPFGAQHRAGSRDEHGGAVTRTAGGSMTRTVVDTGRAQAGSSRQRRSNNPTHRNWSVSNPALRRELNGYLAEHNGLARNFGLSASTPTMVHATTYRTQANQ
jgi:negative regulator of sigma E activity